MPLVHVQVSEEQVNKSLAALTESMSGLGDLTKSTPKRKAETKVKAAPRPKKAKK